MQDQEQLATLQEIRSLMERSSRFTAISGLSGIVAGLVALAGLAVVGWYLGQQNMRYTDLYRSPLTQATAWFLVSIILTVFMLAISAVILLTRFKAKRVGQSIWHQQGQRMANNLCIPLAAGGVFCLVLLYHQLLYLIAPSMLIFYGLALINSSSHSFAEFRYLGLGELALGLVACFQIEYGLVAWGIGFVGLHILYGALIHLKYENYQ